MKSQRQYSPEFSFEFFPPKTDRGREKLVHTSQQLARLAPRYFSVTFGAGGSTQARTYETVLELVRETGVAAAPHLSCIGSVRENIQRMLENYRQQGVSHVVALRGDLPEGMTDPGNFRYANELVTFIREQTGDHFKIEVAAYPEIHPEAPSARADLDNFQRKVEAGADSAITQYFFNIEAYFRFIDECEKRGVNIPIVPGIMPITNYAQLARFSDICGADIPRWIRKRLESYGDDTESIRSFGLEVISKLCQQLLDAGAPGLHFYTLNQAEATLAIWENLGLDRPAA